jgi:hypothetical protein
MLKNGLWTVSFKNRITPTNGMGSGVVVIKDNKIVGGDSGFYYYGKYDTDNKKNSLIGTIKIVQYNQNNVSIFGNLLNFSIDISMSQEDIKDNFFIARGNIKDNPMLKIDLEGKFVKKI